MYSTSFVPEKKKKTGNGEKLLFSHSEAVHHLVFQAFSVVSSDFLCPPDLEKSDCQIAPQMDSK